MLAERNKCSLREMEQLGKEISTVDQISSYDIGSNPKGNRRN